MYDNIEDLIEGALDTKLLSINSIKSQHLDKQEQEVKNVEEQPAERRNRIEKSLQNFRVIHKNSASLNTSQISSVHAFAPILSTKVPENSLKTRSGNTTHANYSLSEYDSFRYEIEPDQEELFSIVMIDIPDNSSNDPLLEEVDLFLFDDPIPPGIENVADDPEGDIYFLEELLIDELSDAYFEDNPLIPRPPPEAPDAKTDVGEEIQVVMIDKDKFDDD
nr:hypothetical protein [Tanacetum cinerariifolium]